MYSYLIKMPEYQLERIRQLAETTGEPMSVWIRRILEYGLHEDKLNQLMPLMSGSLLSK